MSNTKLWAITIFGAAVGWVFIKIAPALQPALIAIVFAYLLSPAVEFLREKLRIKKWLAILILLTVLITILVLLGNLLAPPVIKQTKDFINEFDNLTKSSNQFIEDIFAYLQDMGLSSTLLEQLEQYYGMLVEWLSGVLVMTLTAMLGFIFKLVDMFLILIMTIYFLASGKQMVESIVDNTPEMLRPSVLNLISGTNKVIWNYVRTQAVIALIVGILSTIVYLLIGIRFPILLGFLAGILNFIPYFGSITAAAIATLIALLTEGTTFALITLAAVVVVQQLEGNLITPRLQGKSTGLNPVVILILILVGNYLWGTIGMFIAVPVFGLGRLAFTEALKLIKAIE